MVQWRKKTAPSYLTSLLALSRKGIWHLMGEPCAFRPVDMIRCALSSVCLARWPCLSQLATVCSGNTPNPLQTNNIKQSHTIILVCFSNPTEPFQHFQGEKKNPFCRWKDGEVFISRRRLKHRNIDLSRIKPTRPAIYLCLLLTTLNR